MAGRRRERNVSAPSPTATAAIVSASTPSQGTVATLRLDRAQRAAASAARPASLRVTVRVRSSTRRTRSVTKGLRVRAL
jgi:hypothetical protein